MTKTNIRVRKETRKKARKTAKLQKAQHLKKSPSNSIKASSKGMGPLSRILTVKSAKHDNTQSTSASSEVQHLIDPEDLEIARLEKLLGLDTAKSKRRIAEKLDKEFAMYEGLGADFGSFLMSLDRLSNQCDYSHGPTTAEEKSEDSFSPHVINDSDQEASDIECNYEESEASGSIDDTYEPGESETDTSVNSIAKLSDTHPVNIERKMDDTFCNTYKPLEGEDIYGRNKEDVPEAKAAYVPPGKRIVLDENSTSIVGLKKQINGLLNRLSDQSKDSILRSLKALFDGNSTMVICKLLYDSVMASLENAAGILTAIIPVTAVLVAALTILVSRDISSYLLEELTKKFESSFIKCLSGDDSNFKFSQERERSSYHLASNCCLLLGYLYNYKVVGHTLLMDILRSLAEGSWPGNRLYKNLVTNIDDSLHLEGDIDMINLIMKHCQQNFFSDDPLFLKLVITKLSHRIDVFNKINIDKTRIHFLYDSLVALSLGKSKSVINPITDQIRQHRKWLGSVKSLMSNSRSKEICLSVSLSDLLDADENGRWWRSGAMWNGRSTTESISNEKKSNISIKDTVELISNEEKELNLLAKQLRMNTTTRKSIFVVLMSSQDVTDAFERLMRLNLKGKSDRDIAVVMLECCIQESQYNPFYAELGKLLCSANRQFKTTFTFSFWDFFKLLAAEDAKMEKRKILNSARLLSDLVATFSIPLSVIKSLEVSDLNDSLVLYLSTFFMALFTSEIPDEDYQSIIDRVATTKDYSSVKDLCLYFIKNYLPGAPRGMPGDDRRKFNIRRKKTLTIMEEMSILDISKASTS